VSTIKSFHYWLAIVLLFCLFFSGFFSLILLCFFYVVHAHFFFFRHGRRWAGNSKQSFILHFKFNLIQTCNNKSVMTTIVIIIKIIIIIIIHFFCWVASRSITAERDVFFCGFMESVNKRTRWFSNSFICDWKHTHGHWLNIFSSVWNGVLGVGGEGRGRGLSKKTWIHHDVT